jgi:predicted NBD/HSP70 family sugar kinase
MITSADASASRRVAAESDVSHAAHLRALNLDRVLAFAMEQPGTFTRAAVMEATGLSAPTVGTLCAHLIRKGVVEDVGTGPSRGGRRPSFMKFNAHHGFVVGIDIGPTKTRLAIADVRGERLAHRVVATPTNRDPAALLLRLAREVRTLFSETRLPIGRLLAVGAGAPGAVDRTRGVVIALAPNLKGWSQVPMARVLRRALGAPVVVENDVNLAILGEHWRGAARGHETCAFITVGTGIGAGIMVQGQLHHGQHFVAGEIALMCMGPQFADTDFGARGCLETLAGLKAIAARWSHADRVKHDGWVRSLFDAARDGDESARRIVDDTAKLIAIATANVSIVLDPSLIVLGGALFAQAPELADIVRHTVARIIPTPSAIVVSELDKEAPLWGSLLVGTTEARRQLRRQLRDDGRAGRAGKAGRAEGQEARA